MIRKVAVMGCSPQFAERVSLMPKGSTAMRELGVWAVEEVLKISDIVWTPDGPVLPEPTGIIGYTWFGERYPETWAENHGRLKPSQFGSAILNSVVGHCAIRYGLEGPQILMVRGPIVEVARLQIEQGRAAAMLLLTCPDVGVAEAEFIRGEDPCPVQ